MQKKLDPNGDYKKFWSNFSSAAGDKKVVIQTSLQSHSSADIKNFIYWLYNERYKHKQKYKDNIKEFFTLLKEIGSLEIPTATWKENWWASWFFTMLVFLRVIDKHPRDERLALVRDIESTNTPIKSLLDITKQQKEQYKVEILRRHLIKEDAFNFPKQKAAKQNNSMHPVTKVTKIVESHDNGSDKAKQEWYKKEASDDGSKDLLKFFAISDPAKREVVCAEIMRFFIPETPKYRIFKEAGKTYVVAQGVGYNKDTHKYFKNIETYYDHLNGHIFQPKDLSKILLASMIAGSIDCHTDNIMYANSTIFPIDFGRGTADYEALMNSQDMIDTWHGMKCIQVCDTTCKTFKSFNNIGQYNDEISEAAKEISNLYVNHKDKLKKHIQRVCKALDVPESEMKKTIEYMEKNYQYGVKKWFLIGEHALQQLNSQNSSQSQVIQSQ